MDDILHILGLLRQQAEADIRRLMAHKQKVLSIMSDITMDIETRKVKILSGEDAYIFEKWRQNQIFRLDGMEKNLLDIDSKITLAKSHFKSILAKDQVLQQEVERVMRTELLKAEVTQTSDQLDVFLLQTK